MPVIHFEQNDNNLAIAYYRFSSNAQDAISIERQREAVQEYAQERGLTIVKEYKDEARSGTDSDRPGFQHMLAEVFQLKPAWLLLWSSSRLGRDMADVMQAKKILRMAGCAYDYVSEATPSMTADGAFMDGILDLANQKYSYTMSDDITSGIQKKAKLCRYLGTPIYGYKAVACPEDPKSKVYAVDDDAAVWVRLAFQKCADGVSLADIARDMNQAGQRTTRDGEWNVNGVARMLHHEQYKGVYTYAGVRVEGGMPRLVDDELFERAQERLEQNRRHYTRKKAQEGLETLSEAQSGHDWWLSPYLRCGECGEPMSGSTGHSKTGKPYYYYRCNGRLKKRECGKKHIRAEVLEDIVLDVLWSFTHDAEEMVTIALDMAEAWKERNDDDSVLKSMENRLKAIDKENKNLVDALCAMGSSAPAAVMQRLHELEAERSTVEAQLLMEESLRDQFASEGDIAAFYKRFDCADPHEAGVRDELMRYFIREVVVYDDKVVIRGRWRDGSDDYEVGAGSTFYEDYPEAASGGIGFEQLCSSSRATDG